jgi:DNA mismatch endonuclease, patch repair protein
MVDRLTPERRSWNMGRIRGGDTAPERVVRSTLHALGLRFRLHRRDLPGRPDIVMSRWNTVVFVHGCFWHRHEGCRYAYTPKSRVEFWNAKFAGNVERDARAAATLRRKGWRVITVWECETASEAALKRRMQRLFAGRKRV